MPLYFLFIFFAGFFLLPCQILILNLKPLKTIKKRKEVNRIMDGVRFKTRRINIWNSATIDIEVDDGVKVVDFSKAESSIELRSVKKQFPSVETLIVGKSTSILEISNFMFPNVKEVISDDQSKFQIGKCAN